MWCYNPCFSGSSSATEEQKEIMRKVGVSYNPCFSGSSSATHTMKHATRDGILVTILVFLAALVQPLYEAQFISTMISRYNPCFSGSSSATKWQKYCMEPLTDVTILVFLAALVQHNPAAKTHVCRVCYNPCFSGSSSATNQNHLTHVSLFTGVTILVFLAALVQRRGLSLLLTYSFLLQSLFFWQL